MSEAPTPPGVPAPDKPKKKRRWPKVVGIIAIVLVVGIVGLLVGEMRAANFYASSQQTMNSWGAAGSAQTVQSWGSDSSSSGKSSSDTKSVSTDDSKDVDSSSGMTGKYIETDGDVTFSSRDYDDVQAQIIAKTREYNARIVSRNDRVGGNWYYKSSSSREKNEKARSMTMSVEVPTEDAWNFVNDISTIEGIHVESLDIESFDATDDVETYKDKAFDEADKLEYQLECLSKWQGWSKEQLQSRYAEIRSLLNTKNKDQRAEGETTEKLRAEQEVLGPLTSDNPAMTIDELVKDCEDALVKLDGDVEDLESAFDMATVDIVLYEQLNPLSDDPSLGERLMYSLSGAGEFWSMAIVVVLTLLMFAGPFALIGVVIALVRHRKVKDADANNVESANIVPLEPTVCVTMDAVKETEAPAEGEGHE